MARLTTRQRQEMLFGPIKERQPESGLVEKNIDLESSVSVPPPKTPEQRVPRYYGFQSRHTPNAPWTRSPGRWQRISQAAAAAKKAQDLDNRLEIRIFAMS